MGCFSCFSYKTFQKSNSMEGIIEKVTAFLKHLACLITGFSNWNVQLETSLTSLSSEKIICSVWQKIQDEEEECRWSELSQTTPGSRKWPPTCTGAQWKTKTVFGFYHHNAQKFSLTENCHIIRWCVMTDSDKHTLKKDTKKKKKSRGPLPGHSESFTQQYEHQEEHQKTDGEQ